VRASSLLGKQKSTQANVRPILRWVGGKHFLLKQLLACCPADVGKRRYHEPFLGAASLFLALRPSRAKLSDSNPHLMDAYRLICTRTDEVARQFSRLSKQDCSRFYYLIRREYNHARFSAAQAARFLYLNRTCFNGIFRVNKRGEFNVPYGHKARPWFPSRVQLRAFAEVMRTAGLFNEDYRRALRRAKKGDFVYLDPPYPPLNGTSNFAHYTMDRFGVPNQRDLAAQVRDLDKRGCLVMISNADTGLIRQLYRGFNIQTLSATRYVTCKANKHQVRELVIRNY
jgi:DNA adenine methylase